jgi:hypothetical protein
MTQGTRAGCRSCAQHEREDGGFRLQTQQGPATLCLRCALCCRPLLRRSAGIALVVGTVLVAINQGDAIVAGRWAAPLMWKVPLTYLVPFLVATWGALVNSRVR